MINKVKISVITPFFDGNKYMRGLFKTIENNVNILHEKYPWISVELIIVNDSPSIETIVPENEYHFEYKIIKHYVNMGIQQARITGLKHCNGEYIIFLDQDDELIEDAMLKQFETLTQEDADMVVCNAYMEKNDGSLNILYKTRSDYELLMDLEFYLKSHNMIKSPGQCLINKNVIPLEWQTLIMKKNGSDDLFLWILLFEKKCKIVINKKPLYIHKFTGENLSESENKMTTSSLEIVSLLQNVNYVPQDHIKLLKNAREFSLKIREGNFCTRFITAIKHADLILYLLLNKVKRLVY